MGLERSDRDPGSASGRYLDQEMLVERQDVQRSCLMSSLEFRYFARRSSTFCMMLSHVEFSFRVTSLTRRSWSSWKSISNPATERESLALAPDWHERQYAMLFNVSLPFVEPVSVAIVSTDLVTWGVKATIISCRRESAHFFHRAFSLCAAIFNSNQN